MNIENQEAYDEILAEPVTDALQSRVKVVIESVPYTTCVLVAIAAWLTDIGDDDGARLIVDFAKKTYAVHEANTV